MGESSRFYLTKAFDEVDDLTGSRLGRAKSATFRTADVVGLDTMAHVIKTMQDNLSDDPFFPVYETPAVLAALVAQGALGQKTGAGFYKKDGKIIKVLDAEEVNAMALPGGFFFVNSGLMLKAETEAGTR